MERNILITFLTCIITCFSVPVFSQLVPAFTSDVTEGCSPLRVSFEDRSTGNPTSWTWETGNGSPFTTQNFSTTYIEPGNYKVKLTVKNASGEKSIEKTIKVYAAPSAGFRESTVTGCFPLPVKFTDLSSPGSGSITKWEWDFGDGFTSNEKDPTYTYTTVGEYNVVLKVTNSNGCEHFAQKPKHIKISTGATAAFSIPPSNTCNPPAEVSFIDESIAFGTLKYSWNFGDGHTSTDKNPKNTYTKAGSYPVTLTITNDAGCSNQIVRSNAVIIGDIKAVIATPQKVCAGQQFTLTNSSSPQPTGAFWSFGDGNFSYEMNPRHTYQTSGTYTITLESIFGACRSSATKTIEVLDKPNADFTADKTYSCQYPLTVRFTTQNADNNLTYAWNFGDGKSSKEKNPTHIFQEEGSYSVTLTVTNAAGCTETIGKYDYIRLAKPPIDIQMDQSFGCIPLTVNFSAVMHPPEIFASYKWDFGNGNTSTSPTPAFTFTKAGIHQPTLEYTTTSGCTGKVWVWEIVTGEKPKADFDIANNITCALKPVQFIDKSEGPKLNNPNWHYDWRFGDGQAGYNSNPLHHYSDTGYFDVTLIVQNDGCRDTIVKPNAVHIRGPVARFEDSSSCSNRSTRWFRDYSIDANEWLWDFGDGQTGSGKEIVHTYTTPGNYNVKLTVKNEVCEDQSIHQIVVPGKATDFVASKTNICTGQITEFKSVPENIPSLYYYYWNYGDNDFDYYSHQQHSYNRPGIYDVRLITQDYYGCRDTIIKPAYMKVSGPIAGFTIPPGIQCANTPLLFTDTSKADPTPISSWTWDYGDGTIETKTSGPFEHTYKNLGYFTVTLTIKDVAGCTSNASQYGNFYITKPNSNFESPDILSCTEKQIRFLNYSFGNITGYTWSFGNGQTSTEPNPSIEYNDEGNYDVRLVSKDIFGCTDTLLKPAYVKIKNPHALFKVSDSISTCPPLKTDFTNESQNFIAYNWDFGDNTRPAPNENPTHYYALPGTYFAKLVITSNGGCQDSMSQKLVVKGPQGSFTYDVVEGCKPLAVKFSGTTTTDASFVWDYNNGRVEDGGPDMTYTYTEMGEFLPRMILVDAAGCRVPFPGTDPIKVLGAKAAFIPDHLILCDSGIVYFTNTTTANDPIVGYKWNFEQGAESFETNPSYHYKNIGKFPAQLIAFTQSGCKDTVYSEVPVKVAENPIVDFAGDTSVCMPATLRFKGEVVRNDTSSLSWQWNFGNGAKAASQIPVSALFREQRDHTVQLITTTSSGCKDTAERTVKALPQPLVNAGEDKTLAVGSSVQLLPVISSDVSSMIWKPQTGLSCTTCPDPVASPKYTTTYQVEVTNPSGCTSKDEITIFVFCDGGNLFMPNTFSPNGDGSNDWYYPRGKGIFRVKSLRIFNRWGEMVFERNDFSPNDQLMGWNGYHNNRPASQDVYIYSIDLICENKVILNYKGNVALIR